MIEPKPINCTDEFFEKLAADGKVTTLNQPNHIKAINEVNSTMEETRRAFQEMDKQSQISASKVVLTA
ncbi:MAG: hypothetical protein COZ59_12285 [Bacteroidetes bacterium CG_4_8_14_3_um_filter_31_14]|nr:MAG: hypothetical protein COZ59_12285 [Bacteroidetes bacterium CG_4_8_14_3_um_filter_31_14]